MANAKTNTTSKGKQGGSKEQHAEAGKQGHKTSVSKSPSNTNKK